MIDLIFKDFKKQMFYLLAIAVLGWGFTPYQPQFLGLAMGAGASMYSTLLLVKRTKLLGERVANGGSMKSLGTMTRFAVAIFVTIIGVKYESYIAMWAVVLGLMIGYFILSINFIRYNHIQSKEEG